MRPARWLRPQPLDDRLMHVDSRTSTFEDLHVRDLLSLLAPGDLLVVNDAATLPASLSGHREDGSTCELRLTETPRDGLARAVLFGPGDWHQPTERRAAPPPTHVGERLKLGAVLTARVLAIDPAHPRLISLSLAPTGDALWPALYSAGRPIQYSHLERALPLWAPQTVYAARPLAVEMPSAGRPLSWALLLGLRRRGIGLARLSHAAGLSSTGDDALDAALPLGERYELPAETLEAIALTRGNGGRVVAVGTTVVRALEGCVAERGALLPGPGQTTLKIGPGFRPRVVDGLLTGMHEPTASHFALLQAFASAPLLVDAHLHAEEVGYLAHELGDSALLLASLPALEPARRSASPSLERPGLFSI